MRVLPIASGKGGVGKSLVSVNLAIALSKAWFKVALTDLDLGASNAHTILGLRAIGKGLGHFFSDSKLSLEEIIVETDFKNLFFIAGEAEIPGLANLNYGQKKRLINHLLKLKDFDYLILDLGAGTGLNTLDFFLASDEGIIVTTPSLTSTLNAYLFLKNCIFRIMETSFPRKSDGHFFLKELKKKGTILQKLYLPRLFEELKKADPENFEKFKSRFSSFRPKLILNMLEDPKEGAKATKIRISCKQYLDLQIDHLGIIYRDHLQDIALSSRLPIISYKPQSVISQAIYRISEKIQDSPPGSVHELGEEDIDDHYEIAGSEAEEDFASRSDEIKDLLNSGVLTQGDLLETIRSQQYEIKSLKKESALLKSKLVKAVNQGYRF